MRADIIGYLRCPRCASGPAAAEVGLAPVPDGLGCAAGHRYDAARQGYVDLVAGKVTHDGDTPAMVAARQEFLAAGHYDPIAAALVECAGPVPVGALVLDAGAGTGYHLGRLLDAWPDALGLAVEVSRPALRRAARAHPRALAVRADVWRALPVADASVRVLVNVFAPRNPAEFARVLHPDGVLLVATPTSAHLAELVGPLDLLTVDPGKPGRLAAGLAPWFAPAGGGGYTHRLALTRAQVAAVVAMGPSAWHDRPDPADRLAGLAEPVPVTVAIQLTRYRLTSTGRLPPSRAADRGTGP